MEDEKIWTLYFAGIASIRLHPRNTATLSTYGDPTSGSPWPHLSAQTYGELEGAARTADAMLRLHRERFKCSEQ